MLNLYFVENQLEIAPVLLVAKKVLELTALDFDYV
jgi:hypothetical protein